jgi:hypothetical protein
LKNNFFGIRLINHNPQTAYLTSSTLEWNTTYAPPMSFNNFKFQGTTYGGSSSSSPVSAAAPSILRWNVQGYINLLVPGLGHLPDRGKLLGGTSANAHADACLDGYSTSHKNIYAAALYKHADGHAYANSYRYTTAIRLNIKHTAGF